MSRRKTLLVVAVACFLIAVFAARPVPTPGPFARDFEAYWSAGRTQAIGADPYGRGVWRSEQTVAGVNGTRDELLPFVGPPQALALLRAFAWIDYGAAARIWWTLLALSIAALAVVALVASGLTPRWPPVVAALLFAFSFGPISSGLALGQMTAIAMAGACAAAMWSRHRRIANVAAATVLASLQPNVALGLLALARRRGPALAIALAATVAYVIGATQRGWGWPSRYARVLIAHARAERFAAIQLTPAAILHGAGVSAPVAVACGIVVALLALAAAIAASFTIRDAYVRFACASALVPFVTGFVHEHDLIVAFPAAILAAARACGAIRAATLVGTLLVAIDWLGLAQRPGGVLQSALLAITVASMFAAFGPGETSDVTGACVAALVFAASAWIALRHPLPVWPDGLSAFRAADGASPDAVWHSELARNGLFAVSPATALLRSLSLTGCAVLAASLWLQRRLVVDVHEVVERGPGVGLEPG